MTPTCPAFEVTTSQGSLGLHLGDVVEGYLDEDGSLRLVYTRGEWSYGPLVNPAWVKPLTEAARQMHALVGGE